RLALFRVAHAYLDTHRERCRTPLLARPRVALFGLRRPGVIVPAGLAGLLEEPLRARARFLVAAANQRHGKADLPPLQVAHHLGIVEAPVQQKPLDPYPSLNRLPDKRLHHLQRGLLAIALTEADVETRPLDKHN